MTDERAALAVTVNFRNLALGHEVFDAGGATFVRNLSLPAIYDANFVCGIRVSKPSEVEQLLTRAAREYARVAHLTFRVDPLTPPGFEARLAVERYERHEALVMLLDGPWRKGSTRADIRPIVDEADWQVYADLKKMDWDDPEIAHGLAASNRLKSPPVQYALAYVDGQPVGHCNAWVGLDGMGQVEDLFVHAAYRHRGIATALLERCVDLARAGGVGPVVVVTDTTNPVRDMYLRLGWEPVALCRQYGTTRRI